MKILLLEGIHMCAKLRLEEMGFTVQLEKSALSEEELLKVIAPFSALGIRSKTQLSAKFLNAVPSLIAVGAFCIGTNQIDLKCANAVGVPIFNAPYSNTRSVAELVIAEIISLSRHLMDLSRSTHSGEWIKSAQGAHEVRGKTLGIVGYGHIGSQVSILAEALGLRVIYYDVIKKLPLGNAKSVDSLVDLLRQSDFVTLHVPETPLTMNMIGDEQIKLMKNGSYLINASRGSVVDIGALASALRQGYLSGAAIDVFPLEPKNNKETFKSEIQGLKNVILTPHIGGSTEEAQESIGHEVAESLIRLLKYGSTLGAVNFPNVDCPPYEGSYRLINVHRNVPGVLGKVNGIVSELGGNIRAQYLSTDSNVGYLIMDIENGAAEKIYQNVKELGTSLRTRVLGMS
ncbi:MAG: phosphoglycerate dehydrogenase [Bdellovibrionales bacterium]|nr:phosphoglycerate dehydrogenase [Bdellovibrionales bacterium]